MIQLLTTKELAEKMNVTEMTIYKWRKKGMPYRIKGNGRIAYQLDDVVRWYVGENVTRK